MQIGVRNNESYFRKIVSMPSLAQWKYDAQQWKYNAQSLSVTLYYLLFLLSKILHTNDIFPFLIAGNDA